MQSVTFLSIKMRESEGWKRGNYAYEEPMELDDLIVVGTSITSKDLITRCVLSEILLALSHYC
jgi:hypothetical protein